MATNDIRIQSGEKKTVLRRLRDQLALLIKGKDSPHRVALGGALGIFIGMLPIMGIQMAVVSIFAISLRGNLKAAIVGVWISNPITVIPLYYANYRFGFLLFPRRQVEWDEFTGVIEHAAEWDWGAIKASLLNLLDMGTDIMIPLWGGSTILAVVLGFSTYFLLYRITVTYRSRIKTNE